MKGAGQANGRRVLVPEVVQTSAMDCGPAALQALLAGFGLVTSATRLRDACETDTDGTSIDTLEAVLARLGFGAEQVMLPVDHVLLAEASALPAIVLVRMPNGFAHFVVGWSKRLGLVQVMDPASGRRFMREADFLASLYVHEQIVPARAFRDWAGSERFLSQLRRRLARLRVERAGAAWIEAALGDPSWASFGRLDAATRMVQSMVDARAVGCGREAASALDALLAEENAQAVIPEPFWSVREADAGALGEERLLVRGAVLISVSAPDTEHGNAGAVAHSVAAVQSGSQDAAAPTTARMDQAAARAALEHAPPNAFRHVFDALKAEGRATLVILAIALPLAALGVTLEALLFRSLVDLGLLLRTTEQRLVALALLVSFALLLALVELPVLSGTLWLGRRLEARLRLAFLRRLRIADERYFATRPTSDTAERSHSIHRIRVLPNLAGRLIRTQCELIATCAGIVWVDPQSAPLALALAFSMTLVPLLALPLLGERDARARMHAAAMSRFHLDALVGLLAVRSHGAERALRREHESLLVEWARAARGHLRVVVTTDGLQYALGYGLGAWLFCASIARNGHSATSLLLLYWTLALPPLGQELCASLRQLPIVRNVTRRLLELLEVPVEVAGGAAESRVRPALAAHHGTALDLCGVTVRASGQTLLSDLDLRIEAGSHVAIVGPSGAGKSSLVGLLLGWHTPAAGTIRVDGRELDAAHLRELRRSIAWVDPSVQLWNRSLLDNLEYGSAPGVSGVTGLLDAARIRPILAQLPDGLQTTLGEAGGLLSGGEAQRVRLGRAMQRRDARLVILDEPFRGLDRERRHELLGRARALWKNATLLCVTHDLDETSEFERVLVVEGGRIVEDGAPGELLARASRYRALADADRALRDGFWAAGAWRRLQLRDGNLIQN